MNNTDFSSNSVLADLQFFEKIVTNQKQQMLDTMNLAMVGKQSDEKTTILVASVAETLGEIKARLEILEMALAPENKEDFMVPNNLGTTLLNEEAAAPVFDEFDEILLSHTLPDTVSLVSDVLTKLDNFYYTEVSKSNHEYNWTGGGPVTNIELLVSRETEKELRIRIVSTLKSDALDNIRIEIDGNALAYSTFFDGELKCISVPLPAAPSKTDATLLSIYYSEPCTPQSLGTSADNRCLGLAINSIAVVNK